MFGFFTSRNSPEQLAAQSLYKLLLAQARQPLFYKELGVPDTVDGRFDMILLHAFLVLRQLREEGPRGVKVAQALFDVIFKDMDRAIREIGVGDLSVGKHMARMMKGFNGRALAYEATLAQGETSGEALEVVLRRNVYGTVAQVDDAWLSSLAVYVRANAKALAGQSLSTGAARFTPPGSMMPPVQVANDHSRNDDDEAGMVISV